jgi:hypothetical protein
MHNVSLVPLLTSSADSCIIMTIFFLISGDGSMLNAERSQTRIVGYFDLSRLTSTLIIILRGRPRNGSHIKYTSGNR